MGKDKDKDKKQEKDIRKQEKDIKKQEKDDESSEGPEVNEEFKKKVIKYIEHDDDIKELQKKIKEIKAKKESKEEFILESLDKLNTTVIEVKGSKLIKNKSESKSAIKPEIITKTLEELLSDHETVKKWVDIDTEKKLKKAVEKIMEKMESKRTITEKVSLKRTTEKPKKIAKNKKE